MAYSYNDFRTKLNSFTEEQCNSLLDEIFSDIWERTIWDRSRLRKPIAGSYKKRLLREIRKSWDKIDLIKLEACFQKCGLTIFRK